jgi:hypothetical protein
MEAAALGCEHILEQAHPLEIGPTRAIRRAGSRF